jgi:hypothetical protein
MAMLGLWKLLGAWWRVDRIRASPREGQWLRLAPGSVVSIRGQAAIIVRRMTGASPAGPFVEYDCQLAAGAGRLRVTMRPDGVLADVQWIDADGRCEMLDAEDPNLMILPRSLRR